VSPTINIAWESQTENYFSYRKALISFTVLCDQTFYFQTPLGLLENVIGLDLSNIPLENRDEFDQEVFSSLRDLTKIPSVLMALLTGRLGILWLLNVLFLICVPASIPRLTNKKGRVSVRHNTVGVSQ
jgi:hypothetical protein